MHVYVSKKARYIQRQLFSNDNWLYLAYWSHWFYSLDQTFYIFRYSITQSEPCYTNYITFSEIRKTLWSMWIIYDSEGEWIRSFQFTGRLCSTTFKQANPGRHHTYNVRLQHSFYDRVVRLPDVCLPGL